MVIALSEAEFKQRAEPVLKQLFWTADPCLPTYGKTAESRKILYEYRSPDLKLTPVLVQIGAELGDDGFFFSNLLRTPNDSEPNHWWIPFDEMSVYLASSDIFKFAHILQNAIYSPNSHWGVIRAFDGWGILAGTYRCIDSVLQIMPEIDRQIFDFLDSMRQHQEAWEVDRMRLGWLPICLEMTYGKKAAIALLKEFRLDYWLD